MTIVAFPPDKMFLSALETAERAQALAPSEAEKSLALKELLKCAMALVCSLEILSPAAASDCQLIRRARAAIRVLDPTVHEFHPEGV